MENRYNSDPSFRQSVLNNMRKYNAKDTVKEAKRAYNYKYYQRRKRLLTGGLHVSIGNVSF